VKAALADGGTLFLSDERTALAVPETLRVLLDERGLGWDEAWARARSTIVSRFGGPKSEPGRPFWLVSFLEQEHPRLLELLYEINRRHLDDVELGGRATGRSGGASRSSGRATRAASGPAPWR